LEKRLNLTGRRPPDVMSDCYSSTETCRENLEKF
jgi:hypothetical protein